MAEMNEKFVETDGENFLKTEGEMTRISCYLKVEHSF